MTVWDEDAMIGLTTWTTDEARRDMVTLPQCARDTRLICCVPTLHQDFMHML